MATLSRSKTKAMYSWWWDSHISPKNSKWLKENLTDMDTKVKTMIKLIEVDEDSFVRRAEVYFKRRPELMKLVEEFYRAYRALAERYDHATGVIRHAHKTMSEAFPDQIPSLVNEDGPINIIHEADETPSSRQGSPEPDDMPSSKGSRQLNGIEKARKELNFQDPKPDSDIQTLREAIVKLEAEKEAGLVLYRETMERLAKLESEFCEAKEDSRGLCERACKAEAEVESLKESLVNVEAEREGYLLQYQQCLARILDLEGRISRSEQDSEALKEEIARVKAEKEALLGKYLESLEKIANLENKLLLAKDYSERAEKEVEELKETIVKLTEEKETAVCRYEECLEKIAELERRIAAIEEEAERSNKSLQSEVDSLVQKVGVQDQELSEKQKELGRLWTCVQEERMRFTDAENAFQSLQNLHSKVQEELRSVAGELQKKVHLLKEMEVRSELLEDEVQKAKDENRGLQDDIFVLKDEKGKLEQELELRVEQRNALQQEIYSLKEELNRVAQIHQDAVAFGKGLEEEHSKLEERCRGNEAEIAGLVEKLSVMEKLIEKNELLENSLGNLRAELDEAREKVKSLEESCQLLMAEKSVLISQLQITTENLEKLAERNSILENSLLDANVELEMLRVKSKNLEDSCKLLNNQNSVLVTEKQSLAAQLETTQQKLEVLGKTHADLEQRFTGLEEERESTLRRVEELQGCLEVERKEHSISNQLNGKKITDLESRICVLQEAGDQMRQEFEEELDKAVNAQFDIFLLRSCIHELRDKNASLMGHCEKLQEASRLSEKLISELEHAGHEKQEGLRALSGEIKGLRRGMFELLEAIQSDHVGLEDNHVGYDNEDQRILHHILGKLDDIKISLSEALDENQALVVEKSVLLAVLWQLKKDVEDLNAVILILKQEIGTRNDQIAALQKEMQQLWENNEELIFKVREGNQKEAALLMEMEILQKKLFDLQGAYDDLQEEKCKVVEDRDSLKRAYGVLQEEKDDLEHECCCIVEEAVALDNLSFVFKNVMSEKARQLLELSENVDRLGYDKGQLVEKMRTTEGKMEEILAKNIGLEALLKEAENQLDELRVANDELKETLRTNEMEHLKEHKDLCDTIENLEAQVSKINKEYGTLSSELEKGKDTIELWETMACTFFAELQSACVREAMIKEKFYELIKEYEVMEEESRSKGEDIVELQERVGTLEGENSEIKARLAADFAAIMSLRDSVASLEKHTTMHRKLGKTDEENQEVTTATQLGEHVELQDVQGRIRAVEKAVIELKKRSEEQHSSLRNDLELAMRQILKLKSPASSRRGSKRFSQQNPEEGPTELLMKDIELDRVSSGHSSDGLIKGRRKTPSNDGDQRFEFWESIENQGGHIDIKADKNRRRENRSSRPSSELTVEKELLYEGDPQQQPHHHQQEDESRRKFLERLVSDVEKLNSLQLTVQDLMATADKSGERGTIVRDQLAEKEKTIQRLIEFGGKLVKKIEKSPSFDDSATSTATTMTGDSVSEEIGSGRRRSCREHAKRMSEKIGRLQHEVQKIQFDLLMKLDKDNSSKKKGKKGGARVPEWNSRVLLRDFLYGPAYRTPPKRRFKTRFCACVRPSTIED